MADLKVVLQPNDDLLERFVAMIERLGDGKVRQAEVRALNHVGSKATTAVKRALVAQTSLPSSALLGTQVTPPQGKWLSLLLLAWLLATGVPRALY